MEDAERNLEEEEEDSSVSQQICDQVREQPDGEDEVEDVEDDEDNSAASDDQHTGSWILMEFELK